MLYNLDPKPLDLDETLSGKTHRASIENKKFV